MVLPIQMKFHLRNIGESSSVHHLTEGKENEVCSSIKQLIVDKIDDKSRSLSKQIMKIVNYN